MIIAKNGFFNISNDSRINLVLTSMIVGGVAYFAYSNFKKTFRVSKSRQSFAEDVKIDKTIDRLVRMIVLRAENQRAVVKNISTIRNVVESYRPQIIALINERMEGGTNSKQYRSKLKMLAGEIANQLNISLRYNRSGGLKLALGKSGIPPKERGLKLGQILRANFAVSNAMETPQNI